MMRARSAWRCSVEPARSQASKVSVSDSDNTMDVAAFVIPGW
jgi:hypothetical protein